MAQANYDKLLTAADSRYRVAMIAARRAAQLKAGVPPLLTNEELPKTRNLVSVAMRELELGKGLHWGMDLPDTKELQYALTQLSAGEADEQDSNGTWFSLASHDQQPASGLR